MNTAKVRILTVDANLTADEVILLLWVGVPAEEIKVQFRGTLTGCQVGYALQPADWYEDATAKLHERVPHVAALRRSANDRTLLWTHFLGKLPTHQEQCVEMPAKLTKTRQAARRRVLRTAGHLTDKGLPYMKYTWGAPTQVEEPRFRTWASQARVVLSLCGESERAWAQVAREQWKPTARSLSVQRSRPSR